VTVTGLKISRGAASEKGGAFFCADLVARLLESSWRSSIAEVSAFRRLPSAAAALAQLLDQAIVRQGE